MTTHDLIDLIEEAGFIWRKYSGRGMYGKQCVGLAFDNTEDLWDLAQVLPDVPRPTTDSMGQGFIAYWPRMILGNEES